MRAYVSIHDYEGMPPVPTDVIVTLPDDYDLARDATNVRNRFSVLKDCIVEYFSKNRVQSNFTWPGSMVIGGVTLLPITPYEDFRSRIRNIVPRDVTDDVVDEVAHRLIDVYIGATDEELQTAMRFI